MEVYVDYGSTENIPEENGIQLRMYGDLIVLNWSRRLKH